MSVTNEMLLAELKAVDRELDRLKEKLGLFVRRLDRIERHLDATGR